MGNCNFKAEQEKDNIQAQNKTSFHFQYVIGRGGFGKVWKVELRKQKKLFAMKEMAKARIISKRSVNSVMNEKKFLSQLNHPFLVNMHYAFQDRDNLYLVIDLMHGGDLRYHIGKHRRFSEEQTKFFIACMILCLEFLHANCILHRDIKPENLVFDETGYLRITDLGIARVWNPDNGKDTSGTPGYMAPEVMCRQPHTVSVDYFAAGVIGYECMFGKRPYQGKDRKEIRDHILSKQVQIRKNEIPPGWSMAAADFVNKLILRKPTNRLGQNGPQDLKEHLWFKGFPWEELLRKKLVSPFLPPKEDNFDAKYTNSEWKDANTEQMQQNQALLKRPSVQKLFMGYYHDESVSQMGKKDGSQMTSSMMMTTNTKAKQTTQAETLPVSNDQSTPQTMQQSNQQKVGLSAGASPQTYSQMIQGNSAPALGRADSNNMAQLQKAASEQQTSSRRNGDINPQSFHKSNSSSLAHQYTGSHQFHGYSNSMQQSQHRGGSKNSKASVLSHDQLMSSLMAPSAATGAFSNYQQYAQQQLSMSMQQQPQPNNTAIIQQAAMQYQKQQQQQQNKQKNGTASQSKQPGDFSRI